jgi:hypothetical protein
MFDMTEPIGSCAATPPEYRDAIKHMHVYTRDNKSLGEKGRRVLYVPGTPHPTGAAVFAVRLDRGHRASLPYLGDHAARLASPVSGSDMHRERESEREVKWIYKVW